MSEKRVTLAYGRVKERFNGEVTDPEKNIARFAGVTFRSVMEVTAQALRDYPDAELVVTRYDAPYPLPMAEGLPDLLRHDFEQAMVLLNPPPQRVVIAPEKHILRVSLRHGVDTLADAFGEDVFVARKDELVESPLDGRWVPPPRLLTLVSLSNDLLITTKSPWMILSTDKLLQLKLSRYWLPRRWNPTEGWIKYEDLSAMLDTYRKDKAHVSG